MFFKGHKSHFIFGIAASATAYCVTVMPHTVFLNKLEETVSFYRRGVRVPVNNKVKEMCDEVMNDLKLPQDLRSLIKPFHVFGFEPFHAGTLNNQSGGIVGIPINFTYTDVTVIPASELIINHKPLNQFMKEADDFLNSLILSENAKKYAIAHEILRIQSNEIYKSAYGLSSIIIIATILYNRIVYHFNLYNKKPIYRRMILLSVITVALISWFAFKDTVSRHLDNSIDESISKLGLDYNKGGKDFYDNVIKRNVAVRTLMGEKGEKVFSANGNIEYFLRQKSMPYSHRKNFFESKLQNVNYMI